MSLPSRERGLKFRSVDSEHDTMSSLPSRERGLKSQVAVSNYMHVVSLPSRERGLKSWRAGTTISTAVAPFTGAWIEIFQYTSMENMVPMSLPSRERGLKFGDRCRIVGDGESLPSRERGLKSRIRVDYRPPGASLPSRERGLKYRRFADDCGGRLVAPFTGAWIEIRTAPAPEARSAGRSLHGSVD